MASKKKKRKKGLGGTLAQYLSTLFIGAVIGVAVARARGLAGGQAAYLNARYFSDGFFVAGLILTGIGGLVWISTTGFFDIFGYAFRSLVVLFTALRKPQEHKQYYDYKTERAAHRGKPLFFLLAVGVLFLLLSALCLGLYYNMPS